MTRVAKAPSLLRRCASPVDLMRLARVEPASAAIGLIHRGFYGEALEGDELAMWQRLTRASERAEPPRRPARTLVACVGRRGLKTSGLAAWTLAFEALCVDHDAHALAGSDLVFACIAPTTRQASIAVRAVRVVLGMLAPLGVAYSVREAGDRTELTIETPNTGTRKTIAVLTAQPEWLRGHAYPAVVLEEAGHFPTDVTASASDREILAAVGPGMLQFPASRLLLIGTPGPTGSVFERMVTSRPEGAIVVHAPSWVTNPRITEEQCRAEAERDAVGEPDRYFDQEFRASRFGNTGDSCIADDDTIRACVTARKRLPRPCFAVIGLDLALVRDATAIVVCSAELTQAGGSMPIVRVVVEAVEHLRGSPTAPLALPSVLDRVTELAHAYGSASGAPAYVRADQHYGHEVERQLRSRGVRVELVPMHPSAQGPRWTLLGQLLRGRRLDLPEHDELRRQLGSLRVTQLASGAHKVEGRRDDLADALVLAAEAAMTLPPSEGGDLEIVERDSLYSLMNGGPVRGRAFFRVMPNGDRIPTLPPVGSREWLDLVERSEVEGFQVDAVERWKALNPRWRERLRGHDGGAIYAHAHGEFSRFGQR